MKTRDCISGKPLSIQKIRIDTQWCIKGFQCLAHSTLPGAKGTGDQFASFLSITLRYLSELLDGIFENLTSSKMKDTVNVFM